jgi:hypothetical protein
MFGNKKAYAAGYAAGHEKGFDEGAKWVANKDNKKFENVIDRPSPNASAEAIDRIVSGVSDDARYMGRVGNIPVFEVDSIPEGEIHGFQPDRDCARRHEAMSMALGLFHGAGTIPPVTALTELAGAIYGVLSGDVERSMDPDPAPEISKLEEAAALRCQSWRVEGEKTVWIRFNDEDAAAKFLIAVANIQPKFEG